MVAVELFLTLDLILHTNIEPWVNIVSVMNLIYLGGATGALQAFFGIILGSPMRGDSFSMAALTCSIIAIRQMQGIWRIVMLCAASGTLSLVLGIAIEPLVQDGAWLERLLFSILAGAAIGCLCGFAERVLRSRSLP
ncbi:hypothetical protein DTL42_01955 [Bremerella cremea]|uniref:Uncharacterized protein n=1 Tax=Bremerella cremea TaxID=1031537 RepID=A0A368KUE8_9BACT|nr:hypothetical protein [Bremerella cremea]RCS53951.1 hypothetical protein DTL42_01955 [Bremerella cremea]